MIIDDEKPIQEDRGIPPMVFGEPANPVAGQPFLDGNVLKIYDGTVWRPACILVSDEDRQQRQQRQPPGRLLVSWTKKPMDKEQIDEVIADEIRRGVPKAAAEYVLSQRARAMLKELSERKHRCETEEERGS